MSDLPGTNFDPELDSFLNFDQEESKPTLLHQSSSFLQPQAFPQPSYEYEQFKQTTGLPVGGLANTFAHNQATGLHYRPGNQFVMPTQTLNMPLSNLDEFDFGRAQLDNTDMDFDAESPTFYPGSSTISPAQQAPARIYPGMHTQKAAQAKIQQAQKQEIMRQQQQQKQLAGQMPLPSNMPKPTQSSSKDPHVEESISRILSRMRQSSDASNEDDANSPGSNNLPKFKKDEDEMDDDERLLNSEEGKKLTSKERRQLRNKVSARAFRSRRKEYIGQLEAEVAQKATEANDLRVQNRQLMEENTRLTDLTRMLLSSQAFSGFLHELSQSGGAPGPVGQRMQQQQRQMQQQPQSQQSQTQPQQKDVSNHQASQQVQSQNQQMTVGMTLVPEPTFDMSMFGGNSAWNPVMPSNGNEFQVFSVTELPEPPKINVTLLSGKSSETSERISKDIPSLPERSAPVPVLEPEQVDDSVELDSQKHSLFFTSESQPTMILTLPTDLAIAHAKSNLRSDLHSATRQYPAISSLEQLCQDLDESVERLSRLMQ